MATIPEVSKALTTVMPLFANYKPPSEADGLVLARAWHSVIGHLDAETISAALRVAVTRTEFFPTPKLVLECAVGLTAPAQRTGLEAWGDVKRAIATHTIYHPPDGGRYRKHINYDWSFDDPLVGRIVSAMGWDYLCHSENEMSDRARFVDAYEVESRREQERAKLTPDLQQLANPQRQAQVAALTAGIGKTE